MDNEKSDYYFQKCYIDNQHLYLHHYFLVLCQSNLLTQILHYLKKCVQGISEYLFKNDGEL